MKVAHVVHGYPPEVIGGTERYVERLVTELAGRGHEVQVFCGSMAWSGQLEVERFEQGGVSVTRVHRDDMYFDRWDKGYHPLVAAEFDRFLEAARPYLVHVHHWIRLTTDLVAIAARRGIPAVMTLHDLYPSCPRVFRLKGEAGDEPCEQPMGAEPCTPCVPRWRFDRDDDVARRVELYRADMKRELELAAAVLAPTRIHGEFLGRMLDFTATEIQPLPHGTLSAPFDSTPPVSDDGRIRIVYWSHLHPLKGAHLVLEAVGRAADATRYRVDLFGDAVDDEYKKRLDRLADGLDVTFHGRFQPDALARVPMDVAVIPTLCRESHSFILDEAARLGVPILASDAGALADRAAGTDRVTLFAQNDSVDLARHLDRIAGDPGVLAQMRAAPAPVTLSFEEHVDRLLPIYERARAHQPTAIPAAEDLSGRLADQWRHREALFQELVRIEKWEDVVEDLRRRVAELEEEANNRDR